MGKLKTSYRMLDVIIFTASNCIDNACVLFVFIYVCIIDVLSRVIYVGKHALMSYFIQVSASIQLISCCVSVFNCSRGFFWETA
jgi:hypothetical protein